VCVGLQNPIHAGAEAGMGLHHAGVWAGWKRKWTDRVNVVGLLLLSQSQRYYMHCCSDWPAQSVIGNCIVDCGLQVCAERMCCHLQHVPESCRQQSLLLALLLS